MAEIKPFVSTIPESDSATKEWATLVLPYERKKLPLDMATQQFRTPMRKISGQALAKFCARLHLINSFQSLPEHCSLQ